jgi:hypothetical protein
VDASLDRNVAWSVGGWTDGRIANHRFEQKKVKTSYLKHGHEKPAASFCRVCVKSKDNMPWIYLHEVELLEKQ